MNPWVQLVWFLVNGPPPTPTTLPTGASMAAPIRTLDAIQRDLTLAARVAHIERAAYARQWPTRVTHNLCDDRLGYVQELNRYLDEWARVNALPVVVAAV